MSDGDKYLAFDLGAESGRAILGTLANGRVELEEMHRFANRPVQLATGLHWDVLYLWQQVNEGLRQAAQRTAGQVQGIGLDTWGVDYALLDRNGELLGFPYHYRDRRTVGIDVPLFERHSEWELYARTGMCFAPHNTLCQLLAMQRQGGPVLDCADSMLMMPALFDYWLCGRQANESTIAGTSQFHDISTWRWCPDILATYDLPTGILGELVPSGTVLGVLDGWLAEEVGLGLVDIIATAGHDTPAAVAAVPSQDEHITFISSGTWSVVGTELSEPLLRPEGMRQGFMLETGVCGRVILVHNSMGLWPLQECRRQWTSQGRALDYDELTNMAAQAAAFTALVDPDDMSFFQPGDMLARLAQYCGRLEQEMPSDCGCIVRMLLEGLALRYRKTIEDLERLTGRRTAVIHIVGGGSRNALLCQFTANATGRPVLAGPAEATASATVLLQALAQGRLASLGEVREVVARSYELVPYEPRDVFLWDEAYERFLKLT
jgi:rhamnulokinase